MYAVCSVSDGVVYSVHICAMQCIVWHVVCVVCGMQCVCVVCVYVVCACGGCTVGMAHVTVEEVGKSPDLQWACWRPGSWGCGSEPGTPRARAQRCTCWSGGRRRLSPLSSQRRGVTPFSALPGPPWRLYSGFRFRYELPRILFNHIRGP